MNNNDFKVELVQLDNNCLFQVFGVPKGYSISNVSLENHKIIKAGKLKGINKFFTNIPSHFSVCAFIKRELKKKNWDFDKFPNPDIYCCMYKPNENE